MTARNIITCGRCGYQSKHPVDFILTFAGDWNCMRCYCLPLSPMFGEYIEPDWFTQRYNAWLEFVNASI